jgi:hypothetical protein
MEAIMGEKSIPISLPLDSDGFLRRECPACERQFKWRPNQPDESAEDAEAAEQVEAYYCPLCYQPASPDAWWTKEQLEYAQKMALAEAAAPALRRFKRNVEGGNRGGLLKINIELPPMARPEALTEPDDMVRVEFPCHLEEPVKVDEAWDEEVACLVCGIRYPVDLVRALPDDTKE